MVIRRYASLMVALLLGTTTTAARAAVPYEEDLSGCKLPNDVKVLPAPGTPGASTGTLFKGSTGGLGVFPLAADGKVLSSDDAVGKIRDAHSGDLQYLAEREGSLWAFSGNITEIGSMYLTDAASRQLEAPLEIPKTSRNPAGLYPSVQEGRTYLVLATDGRYMLVRILEKTPTSLVVQYVYQPAAGLTFDLPRNDRVKYRSLADVAAGAAAPPTLGGEATPLGSPPGATPLAAADAPSSDRPVITEPPVPVIPRIATTLPAAVSRTPLGPGDIVEPGRIVLVSGAPGSNAGAAMAPAGPGGEVSLDTLLRQREQMIQKRLSIVSAPTHSDADVDKKAQAIYDLTFLQANEAADVFVAQIAFLNTRSTVKEFSPDALHPCFGALKRLGKAATAASIKGLKQLDLSAPGEGIDSAAYKADLLGRVVRSVEGNDVADFIFRRELDHESDPKRRAIFELILSKN